MGFVNRNGVILCTPWNPCPPPPSLRSLQLLLSSQQQLLCSCRYALCNECYCVCSPQAGVVDARGDLLCLCHLEVSPSSLSGIFVIYHHIVNMFNSNLFLLYVISVLWIEHSKCSSMEEGKKRKAEEIHTLQQHTLETCSVQLRREYLDPLGEGRRKKTLLNELLIDSAEMSSLPLIIIHFLFSYS